MIAYMGICPKRLWTLVPSLALRLHRPRTFGVGVGTGSLAAQSRDVEATGGLETRLVSELSAAGLPVVVVNPPSPAVRSRQRTPGQD